MIAKTNITMDLDRSGLIRRLEAVQGDTNTRMAQVALYLNNMPWEIPADAVAQVRYRKPDGTGGVYDTLPEGEQAWSVSGNTVSVILAPQMLTAAGEVQMQVELLRDADSLATFTIQVHVEENPAAGTLRSEDYVNMRAWLLEQLAEAVDTVQIVATPTKFSVGTVSTLAPGHNAYAVVTQEGDAAVLDLGIPAGYSPTRGVDYWTEAEQQALEDTLRAELDAQVQAAAVQLGQMGPEFADDTTQCTDQSKIYVLPDGYLYAYMTRTEYTEPEQLYDPAAATLNVRHSGTPGSVVTGNGYVMTDYIGVDMASGDPVLLKITTDGFNATSAANPQFQKIAYYDSSKTCLGSAYILSSAISGKGVKLEYSGNDTTVYVGYSNSGDKETFYDQIAYVRIEVTSTNSPAVDADRSLITGIIDPNDGGTVTETGWFNTGHAFVPADYESRILALEEQSRDHAQTLGNLQESDGTEDIPEYWDDHLAEKIAAIQALQETGGRDCFSFAALADIHEDANLGKCSGALAKRVMDRCDIRHALVLGDTATRSSVATESAMKDSFARAETILAPIRDRLLQTRGNHDGCWGDDGTTYYLHDFPPALLHSRIWRKVGMLRGVTADDTGSAYYVDDAANRVRYILLNSHWTPYEENDDGTAKYSSFRNARFGQAQYDWLIREALHVPGDWAIILGTHAPLNDACASYFGGSAGDSVLMRGLLAAYNNREIFRDSFAGTMGVDAVTVEADFTGASGEVIAAVAGHTHTDTHGIWGIPVITVRCDGAEENTEELKAERVKGTVTEQSFDIFTVNRKTRTITATKIGAGADRVINY